MGDFTLNVHSNPVAQIRQPNECLALVGRRRPKFPASVETPIFSEGLATATMVVFFRHLTSPQFEDC